MAVVVVVWWWVFLWILYNFFWLFFIWSVVDGFCVCKRARARVPQTFCPSPSAETKYPENNRIYEAEWWLRAVVIVNRSHFRPLKVCPTSKRRRSAPNSRTPAHTISSTACEPAVNLRAFRPPNNTLKSIESRPPIRTTSRHPRMHALHTTAANLSGIKCSASAKAENDFLGSFLALSASCASGVCDFFPLTRYLLQCRRNDTQAIIKWTVIVNLT